MDFTLSLQLQTTLCHNAPVTEEQSRVSNWRIIRWCVTGFLAIAVLLLLNNPAPLRPTLPEVEAQRDYASFQAKLQGLSDAHALGEADEARFTQDEVNAAFQQSALQEARSNGAKESDVHPLKVRLGDDRVTGQAVYSMAGKDIYLTVTGKIGLADGFLTFTPIEGRIGSMPVPLKVLDSRLQARLHDPDARKNMQLPDYISDIRVADGELIVAVK